MQYSKSIVIILIMSHFCHITHAKRTQTRKSFRDYSTLLNSIPAKNRDVFIEKQMDLEQRIHMLELLQMAPIAAGDDTFVQRFGPKKFFTKKINRLSVEVRKLKKDFFEKLGTVRDLVENHNIDLAAYKRRFELLEKVLGHPETLGRIGDGAETAYTIIVTLMDRINTLETIIQELKHTEKAEN